MTQDEGHRNPETAYARLSAADGRVDGDAIHDVHECKRTRTVSNLP